MRTARPVGLTPDGRHLVVATSDGEEIALLVDERLGAALRDDRARLGQLEIEMDSALRPRDIQARIRAGESLDDVARAAGVPVERVEVFASPVIAEREHVAGLAQVNPVRRRGETTSHRGLRNVVTDALAQRGVDMVTLTWDAWKLEDRRWQVVARYQSGSRTHEAEFIYDQTGRFATAANDDARWLIGEDSASHGPQPGRRPARRPAASLPDDELAIVRAVREPAASALPGERPLSPASPHEVDDAAPGHATPGDSDAADAFNEGEDAFNEGEDAFHEGELTEVDGVYDIVASEPSGLDVLYDMLSSFDEDSVKLYAGLIRRERDEVIVLDAPLDDEPDVAPPPVERPAAAPTADEDLTLDEEPADAEPDEDAIIGDLTAPENTIVLPHESAKPKGEPEQLSLIDDEPAPAAPRKPGRRRRASVPTWDEIMFGAPHAPDER